MPSAARSTTSAAGAGAGADRCGGRDGSDRLRPPAIKQIERDLAAVATEHDAGSVGPRHERPVGQRDDRPSVRQTERRRDHRRLDDRERERGVARLLRAPAPASSRRGPSPPSDSGTNTVVTPMSTSASHVARSSFGSFAEQVAHCVAERDLLIAQRKVHVSAGAAPPNPIRARLPGGRTAAMSSLRSLMLSAVPADVPPRCCVGSRSCPRRSGRTTRTGSPSTTVPRVAPQGRAGRAPARAARRRARSTRSC